MQWIVLRHAEAVDVGSPGVERDFDRHLSKKGRERMALEAAGARALGIRYDRVFSSPLVRAVQTAELAAGAWGGGRAPEVEICEALRPGVVLEELACEIRQRARERKDAKDLRDAKDQKEARGGRDEEDLVILLVGHEPDMSELTARIAAGRGIDLLKFRKGMMAAVEILDWTPEPRGRLLWVMQPEMLMAAGKIVR